MLTDNVYRLFNNVITDAHVINSDEFILLPHQVIPKYYIISEPEVSKLILHYSLGSGKTATAVFILLHYLKLYRMYEFMNHYAKLDDMFMKKHRIRKNIVVVGAWQTQSQIEVELMRPEFGIIKESFSAEVKQLLSSSILEQRQKGEEVRKRLIHEIDRDIKFCGYQSFFNLIFPSVRSDSYGQNVDTLLAEYHNGNISVSTDFLETYRDSIIIIDEMQKLYSVEGMNSFGIAVMALSKLTKQYNIKIVFLTGTMINSSVHEIVDIMNIMSDKELYSYEDYITPPINKDGISVVRIKPERESEIIRFFERKFMYYNQTSEKQTDDPITVDIKELTELCAQAAGVLNGPKKKKTSTAGGYLMHDIYVHQSNSDSEDIDPTDDSDDLDLSEYEDLITTIKSIANSQDVNANVPSTTSSDNTSTTSTATSTTIDETDDITATEPDKLLSSTEFILPFTSYNQVFIPYFIRENKQMRYLIYPKVDLIPQEIHIGNSPINDTHALQPMIVYAVTTEGYQAKAYAQYVNNMYNQKIDFDDSQQSENTIYIQDAYIPSPDEWLKHGIVRDANGNLYGKFLDANTIRQYSAIGYEMMQICFECSFANEKCIIYHNKLNAFGINQYALILQYNGFVRYGSSPVDKSICKECRHSYADHHQSLEYRTSHRICNTFKPICFAVLSGALQQFERDNLTNNIFNNPNNLYGDLISIMFVSDVAYSGVSFFNTNNILILSRIPNVSKWKQIYSRIIRTRSHQGLPLTKQYAKIYTFTIDYPDELKKWKSPTGLTVGSLYYKQREVANEDIKMITKNIADNCVSTVLFNRPEDYVITDEVNNTCNVLLRADIKANMELILKRIMNDRLCTTWFVNNFIRRFKDPKVATSFINLRPIEGDILINMINEARKTKLFRFDTKSNMKFIKYTNTSDVKVVNMTTFDVIELRGLKLTSSNIKATLHKLETEKSNSTIINQLSRLLKLCRKNYMPIVNSPVFWEKMYELGNEYYPDDNINFIHNHTRAGRNKARYVGCYYGNEIIMKDGTSNIINYKFPMTKLKPSIPFTFKITCLVVSENSPFFIHVNIVKHNKDEMTDRRKINKGVICTSANLDDVTPLFPKIKIDLPKKQYCRELLWSVCELQDQNSDYKFVFTPFEK